ncbi:MAG: RsmE family RNA methyltransferase [Tepidisphaera sp.]|nr:RsmE family RNA methyltransferase [Tepidisphaera sp.]
MALHTVYLPDLASYAGEIAISGDEAHHALRVKRLAVGDMLGLADGKGRRVDARIAATEKTREGWLVRVTPQALCDSPRPTPGLTVLAAAPKGDHLGAMIDGLAQVGVSAWAPLLSARTVVEPREHKLERLERIAIEALKQSGASWLMDILPGVRFADALARPGLIIADASGQPWSGPPPAQATLLIGPEGGWTPEELDAARKAGARVARFGHHTMRTEVASVVASGVLMFSIA